MEKEGEPEGSPSAFELPRGGTKARGEVGSNSRGWQMGACVCEARVEPHQRSRRHLQGRQPWYEGGGRWVWVGFKRGRLREVGGGRGKDDSKGARAGGRVQ